MLSGLLSSVYTASHRIVDQPSGWSVQWQEAALQKQERSSPFSRRPCAIRHHRSLAEVTEHVYRWCSWRLLLRQLHDDAAVVVGLDGRSLVQVCKRHLLDHTAGEVIQRLAHDGVILGLELAAIFEDEHCRRRIVGLGRLRVV